MSATPTNDEQQEDSNLVEEISVYDTQGSEAIQIRHKKSNIRLEAATDVFQDLKHHRVYKSQADVWETIEYVKSVQNEFRPSELYDREWVNRDDSDVRGNEIINDENESVPSFTAMQFNLLAEGLSSGPADMTPFNPQTAAETADSDPHLKPTQSPSYRDKSSYGGFTDIPHPEKSLDFSLRRWRLLEVLLTNDFNNNGDPGQDIIALEECDRFYGFFNPILSLFGYQGLFVPKQLSPGIKLGWYSDGCALFWKHGTFELVSEERSSYEVGTQVYIMATLKHITSGKVIIVAVTHLKAQQKEASEKIRTAQAAQLLEVTHRAALDASEEFGIRVSDIATLIMGDFNAEVMDDDSSCIRTMMKGTVEDFKVQSAYDIDPPQNTYFTTWKTRGEETVRRIIDYIFHNDQLRCTHNLASPAEKDMEPERLPGFRYPSDHIAIGARFEIVTKKQQDICK